ncbi:MAG: hypothetical protein IJJ82_03135 [Clostridia bacterium]|nr:hypothetical protein [Clostridia bacterium]
MGYKLFNDLDLTNEEIEKIIQKFDRDIKTAVRKTNKTSNPDYEQIIRLNLFKTLSRNRKK